MLAATNVIDHAMRLWRSMSMLSFFVACTPNTVSSSTTVSNDVVLWSCNHLFLSSGSTQVWFAIGSQVHPWPLTQQQAFLRWNGIHNKHKWHSIMSFQLSARCTRCHPGHVAFHEFHRNWAHGQRRRCCSSNHTVYKTKSPAHRLFNGPWQPMHKCKYRLSKADTDSDAPVNTSKLKDHQRNSVLKGWRVLWNPQDWRTCCPDRDASYSSAQRGVAGLHHAAHSLLSSVESSQWELTNAWCQHHLQAYNSNRGKSKSEGLQRIPSSDLLFESMPNSGTAIWRTRAAHLCVDLQH